MTSVHYFVFPKLKSNSKSDNFYKIEGFQKNVTKCFNSKSILGRSQEVLQKRQELEEMTTKDLEEMYIEG